MSRALPILLCLAACQGRADAERIEALETYGSIGEFALTDQSDVQVSRADLFGERGNVVIANFIFTRCPTVCPVFTMKTQRLVERLADTDGLEFVSFSVDPTHDTPAVLAAFAKERKLDTRRWRLLTGDPETIKKTVEGGLKMALERRGVLSDGTPDIVHATHWVLLDRAGQIRGYYDSSERARIDALIADAAALARGTKRRP